MLPALLTNNSSKRNSVEVRTSFLPPIVALISARSIVISPARAGIGLATPWSGFRRATARTRNTTSRGLNGLVT